MGMPKDGSQTLPTHRGVISYGLALNDVVQDSDTTDALETTFEKLTYDAKTVQALGIKKITHIKLKAVDDVLQVKIGGRGVLEWAANTWSDLLPVSDWFDDASAQAGNITKNAIEVAAAAQSDWQFMAFYV